MCHNIHETLRQKYAALHTEIRGSDDKTVRIWDAETGAAVGSVLTGHLREVQSVAIIGNLIVNGQTPRREKGAGGLLRSAIGTNLHASQRQGPEFPQVH